MYIRIQHKTKQFNLGVSLIGDGEGLLQTKNQ